MMPTPLDTAVAVVIQANLGKLHEKDTKTLQVIREVADEYLSGVITMCDSDVRRVFNFGCDAAERLTLRYRDDPLLEPLTWVVYCIITTSPPEMVCRAVMKWAAGRRVEGDTK